MRRSWLMALAIFLVFIGCDDNDTNDEQDAASVVVDYDGHDTGGPPDLGPDMEQVIADAANVPSDSGPDMRQEMADSAIIPIDMGRVITDAANVPIDSGPDIDQEIDQAVDAAVVPIDRGVMPDVSPPDMANDPDAVAIRDLRVPDASEPADLGPPDIGPNRDPDAPVLITLQASKNPETRSIGWRAIGTDVNDDVVNLRIQFLNRAGGVVRLGATDDPIRLGFDFVTQADGEFDAQSSVQFAPAFLGFASITAIRLSVLDRQGLESRFLTADLAAPMPLEERAFCDPFDTFGTCGPRLHCGFYTGLGWPMVCMQADRTRCYRDEPSALNERIQAIGLWLLPGDTTNAVNHGGAGSCGGGGSNAVVDFTAPEAGNYMFTLESEWNTLLFVRSNCSFDEPEFELACNDDSNDRDASVTIPLERDQTIYLFVDSPNGESTGPFLLIGAVNPEN